MLDEEVGLVEVVIGNTTGGLLRGGVDEGFGVGTVGGGNNGVEFETVGIFAGAV
jgi:hypothetical protein